MLFQRVVRPSVRQPENSMSDEPRVHVLEITHAFVLYCCCPVHRGRTVGLNRYFSLQILIPRALWFI